jgi:hypothetical protein
MDHHCPMMSSCVGSRNLKEYMLFLWHGTAGIALAFGVNAFRLWRFRFVPDPESTHEPASHYLALFDVSSELVRIMSYIWGGNVHELTWSLAGCLLAAIALVYVGSVSYRQTRYILLGTSTIDESNDSSRIKRDFADNSARELAAIMCGRLLDVFGTEPLFWSLPTAGGCRFRAEHALLR